LPVSRRTPLCPDGGVRRVPILLPKSAVIDDVVRPFHLGRRGLVPRPRRSLRNFYAAQDTEPERVAVAQPAMRAAGGFWAMAARTNPSWAPRGPRSRSRPSLRMRSRCANRISTFLRSRLDCSKSLGASERSGNVSGVFMDVARDLPCRLLCAALRFERTYISVELACVI
jgi:hypothetical protein